MARRHIGWAIAALLIAAPLVRAHAQTAPESQGGQVFVLPIGARTAAMGEAGVAAAIGADAVWWNPALISRGPREVGLQITSKSTATTDADVAGTVLYSVRGVGAVALSVRYVNEGAEQAASGPETTPTGTFVPTTTVLAASFAAPFGDRFAFGFTAKILRTDLSCTGTCTQQTGVPLTSAVDLGAQYFLTKDSVLAIAAAAQNFGFNLQVHDSPQADELPKRLAAGIEYAPKLAALPKEARIRTTADVITAPGGSAPGYRFGAELSWLERYQARAGYIVNGLPASGATLGFGFNTGKLQVDFAQVLSDLGDLGSRPTFITLRYLF